MRASSSQLMRAVARSTMVRNTAFLPLSTVKISSVGRFNGSSFSNRTVAARFYSEEAKKDEAKEAEESVENLSEEEKKIKDLETKLEEKTKEASELKDRLLRSVADFRNLQEVTKKDIQKAKDFALQKFAKDLLESVDNFGHALNAFKPETLEQSQEISDLYTGVKMTRDVFEKTLKKHGIHKLDPIGESFDPNKHEATFEIPQPDKEPGTVFHVQQVGYTLNDRVIRPAKVGIVKDSEN